MFQGKGLEGMVADGWMKWRKGIRRVGGGREEEGRDEGKEDMKNEEGLFEEGRKRKWEKR